MCVYTPRLTVLFGRNKKQNYKPLGDCQIANVFLREFHLLHGCQGSVRPRWTSVLPARPKELKALRTRNASNIWRYMSKYCLSHGSKNTLEWQTLMMSNLISNGYQPQVCLSSKKHNLRRAQLSCNLSSFEWYLTPELEIDVFNSRPWPWLKNTSPDPWSPV